MTRRLGRTDIHIEPLVLGTNVVGWTADEATSFAIFDALLAEGFTADEVHEGLKIYDAVGCDECTSGYKGRLGVYQVLPMSEAIQTIVLQGGNAIQIAEVAKASGAGTSVFCIGVDTDQWETVPEARPCLVTSATKLITQGTTELVNQAHDGSFKGGDFVGEAGLAPYHDLESAVPADVRTKVGQIVEGLKNDTVKTGVSLG